MPYIFFCGICGRRARQTCYTRHRADLHSHFIPDSDADSSISSQNTTPSEERSPRLDVLEFFPDAGLYRPPRNRLNHVNANGLLNPADQSRSPAQSTGVVPDDVQTPTAISPADSTYTTVYPDTEGRNRCWVIFKRALSALGVQKMAHDLDAAVAVLRQTADVIGDEIETERGVVQDARSHRSEALDLARKAEEEAHLATEARYILSGDPYHAEDRGLVLQAKAADLKRRYEKFDKLYVDRKKESQMNVLVYEYLKEKYPNP